MKKIISFDESIEEKMSKSEQNNMILPPLLSFQEVCDYLGLGHTIVSKMIQSREIPSTRARNRIRVFATDLREYLDKNKQKVG